MQLRPIKLGIEHPLFHIPLFSNLAGHHSTFVNELRVCHLLFAAVRSVSVPPRSPEQINVRKEHMTQMSLCCWIYFQDFVVNTLRDQ